MHIHIKTLLAAVGLLSVAGAAVPAVALPTIPVNSSIQIGGSLSAVGSTTFNNTTGFDFGQQNTDGTFTYGTVGGYAELGGTGSAFFRNLGGVGLGFIGGTEGTATDLVAGTFDGIAADGSAPKTVSVANLYSFTKNDLTLSFDLTDITDLQRSYSADTGAQTVTVNGLGTLHLTGYEDALASVSLAATRTGTGVTTTFSSSVTSAATNVNEPASMALLGTGLVGAGLIRRKHMNKA